METSKLDTSKMDATNFRKFFANKVKEYQNTQPDLIDAMFWTRIFTYFEGEIESLKERIKTLEERGVSRG